MNILHSQILNKKLLIFDFDGTIADTSKIHEEAFELTLKNFNVEFTYKSIAGQKTESALKAIFKELDPSSIQQMALRKQSLAREILNKTTKSSIIIPGVDQFLQWAHAEFTMIIASSASRMTLELTIEKLGYNKFFDSITCGDEVVEAKPSPEIFTKALSKTSYQKAEAVIFEDSQSGIDAAIASGISCIDIREHSFLKMNHLIQDYESEG